MADGVVPSDLDIEYGQPDPDPARFEQHQSRPIATSADGLTGWLVECGCGGCPAASHPLGWLADEDTRLVFDRDSDLGQLAAERCPSPVPVSLEDASELFAKFIHSQHERGESGRISTELSNYATLMSRDQHAQEKFGVGDITTVLLSLRPSPRTRSGEWRVPTELLRETVNATQKMNRNAKRYADREGYRYELSYVVAGTEVWGTPHGHTAIYLEDPDDRVRFSDFARAVELSVKSHTSAYHDTHDYDDTGQDGAVRIEHDPPLTDVTENGMDMSAVYARLCDDDVPDTPYAVTTYIATQLPYLRVRSAVTEGWSGRRRRAATEYGAVSWAVRGHDVNKKRLSGGTNSP